MATFIAVFIALFAGLVALVCLWATIRPQWLFNFAQPLMNRRWLMPLAVAARLLLGLALLAVARQSALPLFFQLLGGLSIIAALALPLVGIQRIRQLVDWVAGLPLLVVRGWMLVGVALGGLLLFGIHPLLV